MLAGALVVKGEEEWRELFDIRVFLGNNAVCTATALRGISVDRLQGSLESWLLLRSLRTHSLRVITQSKNATELATWLAKATGTEKGTMHDGIPGGVVKIVWHGSLQDKSKFDVSRQQEGGFGPTFAILVGLLAYLNRRC